MNTNIMTLCNLIAPNKSKGLASSGKHGGADGQQSVDDLVTPKAATDNNRAKSNRNEKSEFDETLRKKMNPDTSQETCGKTPKKDKTTSKKEEPCDSQQICNQNDETHSEPEKENIILNDAEFIGPLLKQKIEVKTENRSLLDVDSSGGINTNQVSAAFEKESPNVTVRGVSGTPHLEASKDGNPDFKLPEITTPNKSDGRDPLLHTENNSQFDTVQISQNNDSNNTRHIKPGGTEKSNFEDTISTKLQEKQTQNGLIDTKNSILNKAPVSLHDSPTPVNELILPETAAPTAVAAVAKENPPIQFHDNKPQHTVTDISDPSQLTPENKKNLIERSDLESNLDIHKPASADMVEPIPNKQVISSEPTKSIETSISKFSIARQIQDSVHSSYRPGAQQIVIRLDPPELGRVTVRFIEQNNEITGILHVDKADTKYEIQQVLPGILQNLENSNVPIKKLEVILNNQPQYNTLDDHSSGNNGNHEQQNEPNHSPFANTASYNDWMEKSDRISNTNQSHIELTDNSINMLI